MNAKTEPKIAVLIPAYNEEQVILGTIKALVDADVPLSDVYVINDRSTDKTEEIAMKAGVNVFTVPQNGGKARAQVQGIAYFKLIERYDWIIFLDGDTKVNQYFFNAMFEAANTDSSYALYVGQVQSVRNDHLFSAARAYEYTYGQDISKVGQSQFGVVYVSPGCASMYRTDVLAKLEIDHNTLAEDMDLTIQAHRVGEKVKYLPDAIVHTQDPATLKDYTKQVTRWCRGFWQVILKHKIFGFTKKQRVDWYMMLITIDAVVFNRIAWMIGMVFLAPQWLPAAIAMDLATTFVIASYAGWRTKRLDLVWKFPAYYWISYVNFYAFTRGLVEIVILRKNILAWNKVARYEFNPGSKP